MNADIIAPQPKPTLNAGTPVWDLVIADMAARKEFGRKKYGMALQAYNGRDALTDAYQEALDLCVYLRQEIEERTRLPKLRPNKPERLVVICPRCHGELLVGANGAVATCKCEGAK